MKTALKMLVVMALMVIMVGCSNNVKKVQALVMDGWPNSTVGDAFNASFTDPVWEDCVGERNVTFVQFTGAVQEDVPVCENGIKIIPKGSQVLIQFVINKKDETNIGFAEAPVGVIPVWNGIETSRIAYIDTDVFDGKTPRPLDGEAVILLVDYAYGE